MKIVCIGFGPVARTLIPLLISREGVSPAYITVLCDVDSARDHAQALGIEFVLQAVTQANYGQVLDPRLGPGVVLLNLAVGVSSTHLIALAQERGAMYLDTCVEPWVGGYDSARIEHRTNGWLRRQALGLRARGKPTAVLAHGANPGLVSHFLKQALMEMALSRGARALALAYSHQNLSRADWAQLGQIMDVKVVHVTERDTQGDELFGLEHDLVREGRFVSTWSPQGLLAELAQPFECGWGTHEDWIPEGGTLAPAVKPREMFLPLAPGRVPLRVNSWSPSPGGQVALAITHHEALSISDFLTVTIGDHDLFRPTCLYAYRPSEHAMRSISAWQASGYAAPAEHRVLCLNNFADGFDELGVLLCTPRRAYWYGSTLRVAEALQWLDRPSSGNATTLQVAAGILGALAWMKDHPMEGVVEAEDMDHRQVLQHTRPYLGHVRGQEAGRSHASHRLGLKEFLTIAGEESPR